MLRHIVRKYLKTWMLARYLHCTKLEFNSGRTTKSSLSLQRYTWCLKKSKYKDGAKQKVLLIAFSLILTVITVPSVFSSTCQSLTASFHVLFHWSEDPYKCHRYLSCWSYQFPLNQALVPFFTTALPCC